VSKFDDLFHRDDKPDYRNEIRRKINHAHNTAKNARSRIGSASSRHDLQGPVSDIDVLLCDLKGGVPSKLNDGARARHDKFNQITRRYNNVAKKKRPSLPGSKRDKHDKELAEAFQKCKNDLKSLADNIVSWLGGLQK
jgi:hypothetical protein